jgi:phosphatidylserine/phosphatidylglycerophosphate/cardiolipin synthase-like enzyme
MLHNLDYRPEVELVRKRILAARRGPRAFILINDLERFDRYLPTIRSSPDMEQVRRI